MRNEHGFICMKSNLRWSFDEGFVSGGQKKLNFIVIRKKVIKKHGEVKRSMKKQLNDSDQRGIKVKKRKKKELQKNKNWQQNSLVLDKKMRNRWKNVMRTKTFSPAPSGPTTPDLLTYKGLKLTRTKTSWETGEEKLKRTFVVNVDVSLTSHQIQTSEQFAVEYVLTVLNRVTVASELQVVPSGSPLYTVFCRPYTASYMTIVSLCCVRVKPQKYKRLRAASCSTLCKRSTGLCLCCSEMTRHHILFLRTSSFQNRPEPRVRPQDGRRRWERV